MSSFKYWAFISYAHADNRGARAWADWLHEGLENFPVPEDLAGKPGRHGEAIPARLYPVFQDQKELPSAPDLGASIRDALTSSRHLIVICSPAAARSVYVNEEVLAFKRLGRADRILAMIVEGEPSTGECFPPALRHPLDASGQLDETVRADPIAADLRGAGTDAALAEREKLRLIAGLLGVGFDDLVQRDRERQLREERARARRLRKLVAGFAVLAAAAVTAGVIALVARAQSQKNLIDARHRLAQIYVERSEAAYQARDISQQALLLAEARLLDPSLVSAAVIDDLAGRTAGVTWSAVASSDPGTGEIAASAMSPDERAIAFVTNTGHFIELDTATGAKRRDVDLELGALTAIAISPDGRTFAAGHLGREADGVIALIDWHTLAVTRSLAKHRRRVVSLQFAPEGGTLYSTSDDWTAIEWDVRDGRARHELRGHVSDVNALARSRDGRLLATGSSDGTVKLWRPGAATAVRTLAGHDEDVATLLFTPDGSRLVTAGGDATIRVWNTATGEMIRTLRGHEASISAIRLSDDGRTIISAGADATVRTWDLESGQLRQRLTGHTGWVVGVQTLRDGHSAISCERYGRVIRWALPRDADAIDLAAGRLVVRRAAFSPSGLLAVTGGDDGVIRLWNVRDGTAAGEWEGHHDSITATAFFDEGRKLLTASHDETVKVWDVVTHAEESRLVDHSSLIWAAAIDPAGTRALSGGADRDLRLWNLSTRRLEARLEMNTDTVNSVAFSADGTRAASGANNRIAIVWDVASRNGIRAMTHEGQVASVAFSSDGRYLATAAWGDAVRLWDAGTLHELRRAACGRGCDVIAFSPDGRWLAGGGLDGTLHVWIAGTGEEVRRIPAHIGRIYGLAIAPDGRQVLTAGLNGVARLWTVDLTGPGTASRETDAERLQRIRERTGLALRDGRVALNR